MTASSSSSSSSTAKLTTSGGPFCMLGIDVFVFDQIIRFFHYLIFNRSVSITKISHLLVPEFDVNGLTRVLIF